MEEERIPWYHSMVCPPGFEEDRTSRYEGQLQIYCTSSFKQLKSGGPPAFMPTIPSQKMI